MGDNTDDDGPNTSGDGGSLTFVPETDVISPAQCDAFAQDCAAGEKCVPYSSSGGSWDANKCVPVLGDGKLGEPCTYDGAVEATDSCDATTMCWNVGDVDGEPLGTCTAFCSGTPDDPHCPAGSSCLISCEGSLSVCNFTCNPLLQDCLGTGCYWLGTKFQCVFTTADYEEGEACGFINDCKPGLLCTDASVLPGCSGAACCSAFCSLSAASMPNMANMDTGGCAVAGTECVSFFENGTAPPDYEDLGICIAPPG